MRAVLRSVGCARQLCRATSGAEPQHQSASLIQKIVKDCQDRTKGQSYSSSQSSKTSIWRLWEYITGRASEAPHRPQPMDPSAPMQPQPQARASSRGATASSTSSTSRSKAKPAAPDPRQPTLMQLFSRSARPAAALPPATSSSSTAPTQPGAVGSNPNPDQTSVSPPLSPQQQPPAQGQEAQGPASPWSSERRVSLHPDRQPLAPRNHEATSTTHQRDPHPKQPSPTRRAAVSKAQSLATAYTLTAPQADAVTDAFGRLALGSRTSGPQATAGAAAVPATTGGARAAGASGAGAAGGTATAAGAFSNAGGAGTGMDIRGAAPPAGAQVAPGPVTEAGVGVRRQPPPRAAPDRDSAGTQAAAPEVIDLLSDSSSSDGERPALAAPSRRSTASPAGSFYSPASSFSGSISSTAVPQGYMLPAAAADSSRGAGPAASASTVPDRSELSPGTNGTGSSGGDSGTGGGGGSGEESGSDMPLLQRLRRRGAARGALPVGDGATADTATHGNGVGGSAAAGAMGATGGGVGGAGAPAAPRGTVGQPVACSAGEGSGRGRGRPAKTTTNSSDSSSTIGVGTQGSASARGTKSARAAKAPGAAADADASGSDAAGAAAQVAAVTLGSTITANGTVMTTTTITAKTTTTTGSKTRGRKAAAAAAADGANGSGTKPPPLYVALTPEEQAAAGDGSCIRWTPLELLPPPVAPTAAAAEGQQEVGPPPVSVQAGAGAARRVFQLFSVDIETVDFTRGKNFAAAEKMYLVEVAAVDLGLYDSAYDQLAGGEVGADGDHVFSTLVNCGRKFGDAKTAAHSGIRWSECSAPGVPHTAAALQQLFDFVTLRCQQTAARLSSGTAQSQRQDEGPQGSEWGGASQASAQGQGQRQGPVEVVPVLLAHNGAMFDLPVIRVECGRHGVEFPQDWWYLDTLVMAKALWPKGEAPPPPPTRSSSSSSRGPAAAAGDSTSISTVTTSSRMMFCSLDEADDNGGDGGAGPTGAGRVAGRGGGQSLGMEALREWAGVTSCGQAHRADVDALDLAGVWRALHGLFGRPSLQHLERLRGRTPGSKAAAGPMHRLGLTSLAARTDGLWTHMAEAVTPWLRPPPPPPQQQQQIHHQQHQQYQQLSQGQQFQAAPSQQQPQDFLPPAGPSAPTHAPPVPPPLLSVPQAVELLQGEGAARLVPAWGGGSGVWGSGGGLMTFRLQREQPSAAAPGAVGADGAAGTGLVGAARGRCWEQFAVLLRGVKLQSKASSSTAYKDDHKPRWELHLCAGSKAGEGATSAEELADLIAALDGAARRGLVEVHGDRGQRLEVKSCAKADARAKGKQSLKVLLHAKGEPVTMPYTNVHGQQYGRQYAWQLLAGLSQYDKKTASYLPIRTMRLQAAPLDPASSTELQRIKEDNWGIVAGYLPDVASSTVLDVAVWPDMVWVNDRAAGVRLVALAVVLRK